MAPRTPQRESGPPTTPQRFPETSPAAYPGSDYSFTLQTVMELQKAVGTLIEAVTALKLQAGKQEEKLGEVSKDVHTVKITARIIGAVLAAAIAFAGWSIGKAVDVFVSMHQAPPVIQNAK